MKDYIKIGIEKNLISFNEDMSRITYVFQNKERNFNNPEEKVQAETFLRLILDYNYPESRIKQFVPVTMGRGIKEADIIVYEEDMCLRPHILVECKRQEVSEAEYQQAIEQAYSYAFALPCEVKYVWVTSGIKSDYFEVDKNQNTRNQMPDIPQFGVKDVASYKYVYEAQYLPEEAGKQRFFDLAVITSLNSPVDSSKRMKLFGQVGNLTLQKLLMNWINLSFAKYGTSASREEWENHTIFKSSQFQKKRRKVNPNDDL